MRHHKSNPPSLAISLLRTTRPGDSEILIGDLVESFREGKSRGWFWRQVLIAIVVRIGVETRQHWPHLCYAAVATALLAIPWGNPNLVAMGFYWWTRLPWPLSQFVLDSATLIAKVDPGALPVLWLGLAIHGTFRWISLLRTQILSVILITLNAFLFEIFPSLFHHVRGHLGWRELIMLQAFPVMMIFMSYLVAAWVGCMEPKRSPIATGR